MSGRRLLVLVAVLMGLTALAASVPDRQPASPPPVTSAPPAATAPPSASDPPTRETPPPADDDDPNPSEGPSTVVRGELSADPNAQPRRVEARVGDIVRLRVRGNTLDAVLLPSLDRLEPVQPEAPARFEILAERPGTYPVTLVEARRQIGELVISAR